MNMFRKFLRLFQSSSQKYEWTPDRIYPDDTFIVSYPKSGNTWVRFIIGNYLTGGECTFANNHLITPDIHMNPERCNKIDRPRFIKSHSQYEPKYPNVIYIVRDGRDVAVSYYHYSLKMRNIEEGIEFSEFLKMFNKGKIGPFGKWSEHVLGWLNHEHKNVLLVRYEDLLDDAHSELRRMLNFCGIEADEEDVHEAVEASRFERMQRLREEQQEVIQSIRKSDRERKFLRNGGKRNWEKYIEQNQERNFVEVHKGALERLGYAI